VFDLTLFVFKRDQKGKKVPNDLNVGEGVAKKLACRGDEDDGLLGKGMRPAGRKAQ